MLKRLLAGTKSALLVLSKVVLHGTRDWFDYAIIQHSTACNRRCVYCPQGAHPCEQRLMPVPLFNLALDRLRESHFFGVLSFDFYNEPMLDGRLADLVQAAKARLPFTWIALFTNGDFLSLPAASELISAGVKYFVVSSHGPVDDLERRMAPVVERFGRRIKINSIDADTGGLSNRGGSVEGDFKSLNQGVCRLRQLIIDVDGDVLLCCHDYSKSVTFGNIRTQTLAEIWRGRYAVIRHQLESGVKPLPVCQRCNVW